MFFPPCKLHSSLDHVTYWIQCNEIGMLRIHCLCSANLSRFRREEITPYMADLLPKPSTQCVFSSERDVLSSGGLCLVYLTALMWMSKMESSECCPFLAADTNDASISTRAKHAVKGNDGTDTLYAAQAWVIESFRAFRGIMEGGGFWWGGGVRQLLGGGGVLRLPT